MSAVWKILTLPCEEASRLMSDGLDRELSSVERIALRAHLISCRSCKRFRRQLRVIDEAARSSREDMPDEAKERIKQRVEDDR
jgi:predicted anti-sigma-YlaC factor YlaD